MIDDMEFPRKLLDKRLYVRVDGKTGKPQLIRVEPILTEAGELVPESVMVYVDEDEPKIMERLAALAYIEKQGCVPMESASGWKHRKIN